MNQIKMTKAFIDQTLVTIQITMEKFLDNEQNIEISYIPNKQEYLIEYSNGGITVEERIKTNQEIKELILPYGEITKKLIIEYVKRNLNRDYDEERNK